MREEDIKNRYTLSSVYGQAFQIVDFAHVKSGKVVDGTTSLYVLQCLIDRTEESNDVYEMKENRIIIEKLKEAMFWMKEKATRATDKKPESIKFA